MCVARRLQPVEEESLSWSCMSTSTRLEEPVNDPQKRSEPRDGLPRDERNEVGPDESPVEQDSPPIDDAPVAPLTTPDDTQGG